VSNTFSSPEHACRKTIIFPDRDDTSRRPTHFGTIINNFEKSSCLLMMEIRILSTGEKRSGRIVMATADVKCLLVPLAFLAKHNASNIWGRTVCSLNGTNPTAEQSFRKLVVENRWAEYKKSLADDLFRKRRP